MKWFGSQPWGAFCHGTSQVDTPVGTICDWCEEMILSDDLGVILPSTESDTTFHRCCFLRSLIGSAGHQKQTCACYGGTEEDPPDMTKKQAAEAATALFDKQHGAPAH
jgi:hypothetical protein